MLEKLLAQETVFQEIKDLDDNYAVYRETVAQILAAEDDDSLDEETANAALAQAVSDNADRQLDILDIEVELHLEGEEEDIEDEDIELGEIDSFAGMLSELMATEYQDPDSAIAAVSQASGLSPEEVALVVTGEMAVDIDLADSIAGAFESLQQDESLYESFIELASQDLMEESENAASMSAAREVERLRAEFAAQKQSEELGKSLRQLERKADQLMGDRVITPAERNLLLRSADFSQDEESVAKFSAFFEANNSDPWDYLAKVDFYLAIAESRGSLVDAAMFSSHAEAASSAVGSSEGDYATSFFRERGL